MANFTPQEIEEFLQQFFDVVGARQYVGARYVPIFGRAGEDTVEWDDGAPYEPLTVVMHEGVSYVSRRYVPRDVQITDTDYWVQTYRFNAQVEQYRQEVLTFQGQIDGIRSDLETNYVPFPDPDNFPKYGTAGQVLSTRADGTTKWEDPVVPSDEQTEAAVSGWLEDHPEATTTVLDNSVSDAKLTQSTGLLPSFESVSGRLLMGYARYVNFDTTNMRLEIPADTLIVCGSRKRYFLSKTIAETARTIDLSVISGSAVKVYYAYDDDAFEVVNYTQPPTNGTHYICAVRKPAGGRPAAVTADFPWSIDGDPYGIQDTIPPDSVTDAMLTQTAGVLPSLKSVGTRLIMGYDRYVDFDTTNKTMTIPTDTQLIYVTTTRYNAPVSLASTEPRVIDLSSAAQATSAFTVCYDIANGDFVLCPYTFANLPGLVYLCAVRRSSGGRPWSITADFPWSIDGNPYGIDTSSEQVNYMPYVASGDGRGVHVANHRGWWEAPENTMPAFRASVERNYQIVETDVASTSDGVFVLLHDASINRTARNADGTQIQGTVNINDITYAQALEYDFGIYQGSQYAGTKIPTLEEFLVFCRAVGNTPYLELKSATLTLAQIPSIVSLVNQCGMRGKVTYISFNESFLASVCQEEPKARVGLLLDTVTAQGIATAQSLVTQANDVFIDAGSRTDAEVSLCMAAKIPMEIWTINYADMLPSVKPYITGVTTDKLDITKLYYDSAMVV